MRKKRKLKKREILPDIAYNSLVVAKAINLVMWEGKKQLARRIIYNALERVKEKTEKDPLEVFEQAIKNVAPSIELKNRKVRGANYQVPVESSKERREVLALRWLIKYSRKRSELTIVEALAAEIIDASNNTGLAIKRKIEVIKTAESNKAFAYYRF
ncbi:30S ribosomal protein S7 [Mycoplasma ovis str. Michigan]|uniref:Small ribosomal subunit protein uS7 n=1 Tax=Mycoplasma ovis str. Michigan TaxID=1415773 RepID=A0ABM5P0G1_9MOLU|nr:30S ribosomal protein S7 [Mycoplasma ovis]AHC39915.1 30S ribosomal protein S7 [Mycoplasma ovis str. Michigan]